MIHFPFNIFPPSHVGFLLRARCLVNRNYSRSRLERVPSNLDFAIHPTIVSQRHKP